MGKVAMIATEQLKQAPVSSTTTERLKVVNEQVSNDIIYKYWEDYGQFGNKQPRTTGLYSKEMYTNSSAFLSYDTAHAEDRKLKHMITDGLNAFDTFSRSLKTFPFAAKSHSFGDYGVHF